MSKPMSTYTFKKANFYLEIYSGFQDELYRDENWQKAATKNSGEAVAICPAVLGGVG